MYLPDASHSTRRLPLRTHRAANHVHARMSWDECADVSEWADSFGDTCGLYVAQQYCTDIGDWGPGWNPQ